ncbi:YadA-like family protein [Salmonella enterica]|nr:YadA-like family protein [Salmonella enterica]
MNKNHSKTFFLVAILLGGVTPVWAAGYLSTETGQGATASGQQSTATGQGAQATANYSTATGQGSVASGEQSTATGLEAVASGYLSTATGKGAQASGEQSTATGLNSKASGSFSTATGLSSRAEGVQSTATGHGAQATGDQSTATGQFAVASGNYSTATGQGAVASKEQSSAMGQNAQAVGEKSTAIGSNAYTSDYKNSVALGADSRNQRADEVNIGGMGNAGRYLGGVKAGEKDDDAVNLKQMKDAAVKQDTNAQYYAGTALKSANTYTDNRVSELKKDWDNRLNSIDKKINKTADRANAGIASVAAMSNIPFINSSTFSAGLGIGNYRNGNALAGGIQYNVSDRVNLRASISWNNEDSAVVGGGIAVGL